MKPKRPTETDLLTIVQNGFQEQLPKDRETRAPAPTPRPSPSTLPAAEPAPVATMVRITLTIPEDLRYRLKLAMMDHRRRNRSRITQDEFCAKAIRAQLDLDESGVAPHGQATQCAAFLRDCLHAKGFTKAWMPKATALLDAMPDGTP